MLSYDGAFQMTEKTDVMFDTMGQDKERWVEGCSVLVDCMFVALRTEEGRGCRLGVGFAVTAQKSRVRQKQPTSRAYFSATNNRNYERASIVGTTYSSTMP